MANQFVSPEGDLENIFVSDYGMIDQYNQLGTLWTWGFAGNGQLGNSSTTAHRSSPAQTTAGGITWKSISAGAYHNGAIKTDGTLWLWGFNTIGGALGDNTLTTRTSPVQTVSGGTTWNLVSCGCYNTAAIKTDGTLWVWGRNLHGALGDNTITSKSSPVQTVSGGTTWKSVACGGVAVGAIKTDGRLYTWGQNANGQLGDSTTTSRSSPIQTSSGGTNWKLIQASGANFAAIKTDGTLWLWGKNTNGQIGNNSNGVDLATPTETVSGGTTWRAVSIGAFMSSANTNITHVAAIKTDGTLWSWGYNTLGALGNNSITLQSSPVQTVSGGTNWKFVGCGAYNTGAIKTDGTLWLWGRNNYGRLGNSSTTNRSSPVQTTGAGTNWKLVGSGGYHTAAVKTEY